MTLTELRYIVAVARERHFGRAASACFVSQPTLSVGVKRIEDTLGVQIFERASRTELRITPRGEVIIEQAQRVLQEVAQLQTIADAAKDPLVGTLRIGLIYTIGPYLLPSLIPALHQRAPRMPIEIVEGFTHDLAYRLQQGSLDAVVLSLPFTAPRLVIAPVYREPFTVAVPSEHPWVNELAHGGAISVERLAEQDLLMLGQGHCFRDQVLSMCPACAQPVSTGRLQKTLEGGSLETMRMMVASGAGITVLPCSSNTAHAGSAGDLIRYLPFDEPVPFRDVAVASRARFARCAAINLLSELIREQKPACCQAI
ncbi:MAG: LysR substrate-binding domain-containing protein [Halothiobacillus sp.]